MDAKSQDVMENLQQLIGEELEKYHEDKIKRDLGEEPSRGPRPGLKPVAKRKLPNSLLRQYFELN